MRYRFYGDVLQLVKYVITLTLTETDIDGNNVSLTEEYVAVTEDEKNGLLERYVDAVVEAVDNTGYEWLDGMTFTQEQIQSGEVERLAEMGEEAYFEETTAPTQEDYLIDLDYRLSMVELGL